MRKQSPQFSILGIIYLAVIALGCVDATVASEDKGQQGNAANTPESAFPGLPEDLAKVLLEAQRTAPKAQKVVKVGDALGLAATMSQQLTGDEDVAAAYQARVAVALAEAGRLEEAMELASAIRDYRRDKSLLEIAGIMARRNLDITKIHEIANSAEISLPALKPRERDQLCLRLIQLSQVTGWSKERLDAVASQFSDKEEALCGRLMRRAVVAKRDQPFDLEAALKEIAEEKKGVPLPEILDVAWELSQQAFAAFKRKDEPSVAEGKRLIEAVLALLAVSNTERTDIVLDISEQLIVLKQDELAKKVFATGERGALGPLETDWMAKLRYKLVNIWRLRGLQERLLPLLEESEKSARKLRQMERPYAYAWMAAAWRVMEKNDRSEKLMRDAAQEAITNVNPRTARLGVIEICLCSAALHHSLDNDLFHILNSLSQGDGSALQP